MFKKAFGSPEDSANYPTLAKTMKQFQSIVEK